MGIQAFGMIESRLVGKFKTGYNTASGFGGFLVYSGQTTETERSPMGTDHDFNQIYADYFPRIHRYLTRFAGPFQAEDLAQEVFNKVHKGLPKLGATARLSAWIYRIATNTAIDRTRTREFKTEIKTGTLEDLDPGRPGPDKLTAKQPGNAIMQGMPDRKVIKAEMKG